MICIVVCFINFPAQPIPKYLTQPNTKGSGVECVWGPLDWEGGYLGMGWARTFIIYTIIYTIIYIYICVYINLSLRSPGLDPSHCSSMSACSISPNCNKFESILRNISKHIDFGPEWPYIPSCFMHKKLFGAWGGPGPWLIGIGELGGWLGLGRLMMPGPIG